MTSSRSPSQITDGGEERGCSSVTPVATMRERIEAMKPVTFRGKKFVPDDPRISVLSTNHGPQAMTPAADNESRACNLRSRSGHHNAAGLRPVGHRLNRMSSRPRSNFL